MLVADGSTGETEPDASDASPESGTTPEDPLVGSYDVQGNQGDAARLDIRKTSAGYEAIITPSGGHPTSVSMMITDTTVELSGNVAITTGTGGFQVLTWVSISVPRTPDGHLDSGPVIGAFRECFPADLDPCGLCIDQPIIGTVPALVRDTTAPSLSLGGMPSNVPPGQILPWDSISIRVSEGVPASELLGSLSLVQIGTTEPVAGITWNAVTTPVVVAWDAVVQAEGRATDWNAVAGKTAQVVGAAGVPDPTGNSSAAFASSPIVFADVGQPRPSFDFDQPTDLAIWGTARLAATGTTDADLCEAGGCALIGPLVGGGIAGRLASGTSSELHLRYRLVSSDEMVPGTVTPPWAHVEIVRPGQQTAVVRALPVGSMHDLGTSAGALHWSSDWITAVIPMPPPASGTEIGFRIGSAVENSCRGINARLVIDSITTG